MPRASGSGKRQLGAGAGPRDARHDNGLVGPGKRISANRSNGCLNGSAKSPDSDPGHAPPSQPLPPSPPPPPAPPSSSLPPNGLANGAHPRKRVDDAAASSGLDPRPGDALRRPSLDDCSELSSESCHSSIDPGPDSGYRQIDVNAMKNADVHRDSGPLELAATVVRSLPVQDTLAMLIILMHIPYLSLTLVYACFASLTFVPPVASRAGWNINFGDILDGNSHTPSLATVVCMDFFFFLIWVFLWPPIQDSMLEFAKPVIAVTLGGGTSAKDGTSRGVTACFAWVLLHKLVRSSRRYWPRLVHHLPDAWRVPAILGNSLPTATTVTATATPAHAPYDKRDTHGWIQSVLAIHILTQGIVRYIREWYLRRERSHAATGLGDPETAKASVAAGPGGSNASGVADLAHEASSSAPDTEAAPTAPSSHAVPMTKKRRKQSAQVRLQQPLWAALASTKIVAMKEIELSSWAGGSFDKRDIHNAGNAPSFDRQQKQIWISYIGSDEVCFSTSHFPEPDDELSKASGTRPAGVDTTKPFYVRINNAFWQPTRIFPVRDAEDAGAGAPRWSGDIYGLRPASKYVCEFVHLATDQVLFMTSIRTVKEPLRDRDMSSSGLPNGQQPLRPDSPATTLRTSIAAAEAKFGDEKNRLKTWRKEWKIRINTLKRENELSENQLSSAGNSDERYKQKIRQQETQKAQTERDTQGHSEQLKHLDAGPELTERKKKADRAYSAEKRNFDGVQKELRDHKSQLAKEVKAKEGDKSNLNTRRNKTATRIAKVETEHANIADANSRGQGEAEHRRQDRRRWMEQVTAFETNYSDRLTHTLAANKGKKDHVRDLQAQVRTMHDARKAGNGMKMDVNQAMVPEAGHASFRRASPWGSNPMAPSHYPWAASSSELPSAVPAPSRAPSMTVRQPPPASSAFDTRSARARCRSSSLLSDVSGLTQASDDGTASLPVGTRHRPHHSALARRNGASGSSGSSGSGSIGDPTSPA